MTHLGCVDEAAGGAGARTLDRLVVGVGVGHARARRPADVRDVLVGGAECGKRAGATLDARASCLANSDLAAVVELACRFLVASSDIHFSLTYSTHSFLHPRAHLTPHYTDQPALGQSAFHSPSPTSQSVHPRSSLCLV